MSSIEYLLKDVGKGRREKRGSKVDDAVDDLCYFAACVLSVW